MRVMIAGGHGKIALLLERLLAGRGDQAVGLIRNPAHVADVQNAGAEAVVCDLEAASADDVAMLLAGAGAVVFAAGAGAGSGAGFCDDGPPPRAAAIESPRSRLRRGLHYLALTSGNVVADVLPGRVSGTTRLTEAAGA
jgi:hypothetical protein